MHLSESSFNLRSPILIAAFEGWNDAAESATSAITHLLTIWSHSFNPKHLIKDPSANGQ